MLYRKKNCWCLPYKREHWPKINVFCTSWEHLIGLNLVYCWCCEFILSVSTVARLMWVEPFKGKLFACIIYIWNSMNWFVPHSKSSVDLFALHLFWFSLTKSLKHSQRICCAILIAFITEILKFVVYKNRKKKNHQIILGTVKKGGIQLRHFMHRTNISFQSLDSLGGERWRKKKAARKVPNKYMLTNLWRWWSFYMKIHNKRYNSRHCISFADPAISSVLWCYMYLVLW